MSWNYAYTPYLLPSAGTALFMMVLAVYCWRRRGEPGAIQLMIGCLFGAVWAASSTTELAAVDLGTKINWNMFQSCIEAPIVIAVTCFILEYALPGRWLSRRNVILQTIVPVVFVGLVLTNDFHHLAFAGFLWDGFGPVQRLSGPASWFFIYTLLPGYEVVNLIVFGWLFTRSRQHRLPIVLMLVGQIVGRTLYILVMAEVFPRIMPIEQMGMAFEFLMYAVSLFGFHMLDPIPMARQTTIEQLRDGMLVLDTQGNVASLNPAAERILETSARAAKGKPIRQLLPDYPETPPGGTLESEISLGTGQDAREYILTISRLNDWRGLEVGRLVMMRDVTERKQAQVQILEQQRALAVLQEREHLARELHDGIGQVLGYVKLQTQAIRDRLMQGDVAGIDGQLAQLIMVAQEAHTDVREYILGVKTATPGQAGFLAGLRQYLKRFSEVYGLRTELVEPPAWSDDFLEPTTQAQLLRIVQEALTNVRKHAQATCVQVVIHLDDDRAQVTVQDDGIGFDLATIQGRVGQSYGLDFLRERAAEVGGNVNINSAPSHGTRVMVEVPRRL